MALSRDYRRPFWRGFLHAVLVLFYCTFVGIVLFSFERLVAGEISEAVMIIFSLFFLVLSVAVCGYLVFYEPVKKLLKHHFRAASVMMMSTLGWLFIFLIIFLMGLVQTLT